MKFSQDFRPEMEEIKHIGKLYQKFTKKHENLAE